MIVLFPQVSSDIIYNEGGCWNNYFNHTNAYTSKGLQTQALKQMIDRVLEPMHKEDQLREPRFRYWNFLSNSLLEIESAAVINDDVNSQDKRSIIF